MKRPQLEQAGTETVPSPISLAPTPVPCSAPDLSPSSTFILLTIWARKKRNRMSLDAAFRRRKKKREISFCCPPDTRSKKVAANKGKRRRRLLLPLVFFPTEFGTSFTFLPDQECSSQLQKSQQAPVRLEMCRIWARVEKIHFRKVPNFTRRTQKCS